MNMKKFRFALTCLLPIVLVLACNLITGEKDSEIDKVATPTFVPPAGTYSSDQSVMIDCATSGATIYYTTEYTTPNENSTLYTVPISVSGDGTSMNIKAIATKTDMADSAVASAGYVIDYAQVATPIFNPAAGIYSSPQTVTISTSTAGASIRNTTDGSTPTSTFGTLYSASINVATSTTIKAIAYASGWTDSLVATATYTLIDWQTIGIYGSGIYQFADPSGVTLDSSGHIYVADTRNARIVRMDDMSGAGWTTFYFDWPHAIALDSEGHIYVADSRNCQIVRMDDMTGAGWIKLGVRGSGTGQFDTPTGVALDASGRIYIADLWNYRIVRVDNMSGAGWTTFGASGSGTEEFNRPANVSVDAAGKIYIADHGNCRIVRMDDMSGAGWTTFGTSGSGTGEFNIPWEVFLAADGYIYVADTFNHRIVRMNDMSGTGWTTLGSLGSGTGQFYNARGCAVDTSGYIYVADGINCRIVRFIMP